MLARNRARTIKIILVLFHETSLHTQKKFFAKRFNLWFALTLSWRFTKCLKQCVHTFSHRTDTLKYIRQVSRTITMLSNQYFSGQVMNSNIGLEVLVANSRSDLVGEAMVGRLNSEMISNTRLFSAKF